MCPLCPPLRPQMHPKSYQQNYLAFNFCTSVLYCQNRNTYVHQSLPRVASIATVQSKHEISRNISESQGGPASQLTRTLTLRYLLYTRIAVSGMSYERANFKYSGHILWCCVRGRAWRARSKVCRVFVTLHWSIRNWQ